MKNQSATKRLWASHQELLAMAILQKKSEPEHTVIGLEAAIAAALKVGCPRPDPALEKVIDQCRQWEAAAQLLAKSIQNPNDKTIGWRAVIAFVAVNGSPTPK